MPVEAFLVRFGANFAGAPKGPGPLLLIVTLATLAMSAQEVHAATRDGENYRAYLDRYSTFLARRLAQGDLGRGGFIERPLGFEEWQKSNRIAY